MPPATNPIPVLLLDSLASALALIAGGSDYYHTATFAGYGKDITRPVTSGYPATFIGDNQEIGQYVETQPDGRVLWHGVYYWECSIYGVVRDAGSGDEAYRSLLKLGADIYRAVLADPFRTTNGTRLATMTEVRGWKIIGPKETVDGLPWVEVVVQVRFRTRDNEMVTVPA